MKKLVVEFSNERLITPSGLSLVGQMLGKSNFIKKCNNMKIDGKRSQSQIKNGDILLSYIGLLCQGKTSYDAIHEMSDDPEYFKLALGITRAIPSAETLRQRMDDIGTEGFLVNTELRAGSQHCQCNTPAFLKQTLKLSHQLTDKQLLIRMDAGNDAAENLGILIEDGSWFIVKRNLRRGESKDEWISKVRECCKDIRHPRDGKTVYIGSSWKNVEYTDSEGTTKTITMRIVYEIIERTMDKNGQYLMIPDIECNTIWTNLGWSDDDIINGYHAHGECEQFHSEIKTDMDVERLPSGKFDTNELVLELTVIAYNILRLIGQESLKSKRSPKTKHPVKRRRIRTVIGNLIQIAGHVTTHGRRIILAIGCSNIWRHAFMDVYNRFAMI